MGSGPLVRPVRESDIPAIARLDREAWYDPSSFDDDEAMHLTSRLDILRYLPYTTYGEVAQGQDGSVLGITLGVADGEEPLFPRMRDVRDESRAKAAQSMRGSGILRAVDHDIELNERLLAPVRHRVAGELQLFIVTPQAQGKGIGGRLFRGFLEHLRSRGVSSYFLYTDSECDFGFYDAHGLERAGELRNAPAFGSDGTLDKYIYVGNI